MRFRSDLHSLMISLTSFQSFDHGGEIEESVPEEWNLLPEDIISWHCAQFYGTAEVVRCEVNEERCVCVMKKVS